MISKQDADFAKGAGDLARASDKLNRVALYAARGRRFASRPSDELAKRFVSSLDASLASFPTRHPDVDDIRSEYELRGEEPPYELAAAQIEAIAKLAARLLDTWPIELQVSISDIMTAEYRSAHSRPN